MNIGIVGSRSFNNYALLHATLEDVHKTYPITTIVSGGAKGADTLARTFANTYDNVSLVEYLPDWDTYGKSAGFIRNKLIWDNSDVIVAFWDSKSRGTKHTIDNFKGELILVTY